MIKIFEKGNCCERENHADTIIVEGCCCNHSPINTHDFNILAEIKALMDKLDTVKSPYIGDNGNWFYYDETKLDWIDSGVKAQGEKGNTGDIGPEGAKGDKGDTGALGPQGAKGDTGGQGEKGPQGIEGKQGYTPIKGTDYFTAKDIESLGIADKVDKINGKSLISDTEITRLSCVENYNDTEISERITTLEGTTNKLLIDVTEITTALSEIQVINYGDIKETACTTAPIGWLVCDGSAISRATYANLFDAIGTIYGAGDNSTTFNIPDFRGRVSVGKDSSQSEFDTLGKTSGEKTHILTINEMPSHVHTYSSAKPLNYGAENLTSPYTTTFSTASGTTGSTGENNAHNNLQPYLTINKIIYTGV